LLIEAEQAVRQFDAAQLGLGMDRQLLDSPIYRGRKLRKSISLLCFPKFLSEACSADVRIILQIEHRPARLSQDTCALLLRGFQSGFQLA
ncbi:hypothetical protein SB912_28820, partial [Pantoea sp. SIMBA_072]